MEEKIKEEIKFKIFRPFSIKKNCYWMLFKLKNKS